MVRFKDRALLASLEWIVLLSMLVALLAALLGLLEAATSETLDQLKTGLPVERLGDVLPDGMEIRAAEGVVTARADLGYRLAWWVVGPASGLLVVAGGYILYGIVLTVQAGDPFVAANVRRLRLLGALTVTYFLLTLARPFVAEAIQSHLGVADVRAAVAYAPIISAIVLFVLAEIWHRGVDLADEQHFTV